MNNIILSRLEDLRASMAESNIDAFIIPGTDPHMSEYIAQHWKCREWISGFNGSAGTIVVTNELAGLWTDSRYFLQADQQLEGTSISLFKEGLPDTPSIEQFLIKTLDKGQTVAVDGNLFPISSANAMHQTFKSHGIEFRTDYFPFDIVWKDRPALPKDMAFVYPEFYTGESLIEKRHRILEKTSLLGANALILTALDDIAWTLNLRGTDVECNPVAICYLFVSQKENIIFIDKDKVTQEVLDYFNENSIIVASYDKITDFLAQLPADYSLLVDPAKVNEHLHQAISKDCNIVFQTSPVALLKAVKNTTEIEGFRRAMIKDGVALTKFFRWLDANVESGNITECSASDKLTSFREEQDLFVGESFGSIVGFKGHGAIVHYRATAESDATITNDGILLIDSGGQYFDGTTDITRTVILGEASDIQKRHFTLVLKGHIDIALAKFPQGTRGDQLDVLARKALWNEHLNYLHGTGHGVGHFLNVHEGPQSIRLNHNPTLLEPGMVTSNEPGLYITDQYGIRLENLILTQLEGSSAFGDFYGFETLTLFPFDLKGIEPSLLSTEQKEWLNNYHSTVYDRLAPALDSDEHAWLKERTKAI